MKICENNIKSFESDECIIKVKKTKFSKAFQIKSKVENSEKQNKLFILETLFNNQPKKIAILKGDKLILNNKTLENQLNNGINRKSFSPSVNYKNYSNSVKIILNFNDENSSNNNFTSNY